MIKPGTLCMIRGVPADTCGADCNGKIVVVDKLVTSYDHVIYTFTPEVYTIVPFVGIVNSSPPEYLHPLDNPPQDAIDTHSTRKETA